MLPQLKIINPRCYFCGVESKAKKLSTAVRNHLTLHTNEKSYKCPQCGKSHRTNRSLRRHEVKAHFLCCKILFSNKSEFTKHYNKLHKKNKKRHIKCSKCNCKFFNNEDLLHHQNSHGRRKRAPVLVKCQCPECFKTLNKSSLKAHIRRVHTKERNHQCVLCPKKFHSYTSLTTHTRTHTGEKDLRKCNEPGCNEISNSRSNLKVHKRTVHRVGNPEGKIVCPHCKKAFPKSSLKNHVDRVHMKLLKHICKFCSKAFFTKTALAAHTVVHTNEKPYQCNWPGCYGRFSGEGYLYTHIQKHKDKESKETFSCKEANCEKIFDTRSQLRGHINAWHKFTLFKCYFCGILKKFRTCLMEHMVTKHLGERGYKCGQCPKGFYTSAGLTAHIDLTHGGRIKPCYFCGKKMASYNVIRHLRTHTEEKFWQCGFCGMDFCVVNAAQQHVKRSHLRASSLKEVKKHTLELNGKD